MVWRIKLEQREFVVKNYRVRKLGLGVGKKMELGLGELVLCGQRWSILLFPEGETAAAHNQGCASLYVTLKSRGSEPLQVLASVGFLDQAGMNWGVSSFDSKRLQRLTCSIRRFGLPEFIMREKLDSCVKQDGSLKIYLTIGVLTEEEVKETAFERLLNLKGVWGGKFILFQLGGGGGAGADEATFCGAKSIIAARCPLLLSDSDDHLIIIPDMDPPIFAVVLWFIYTGTLGELEQLIDDSDPQHPQSFAPKLLAAAHRFQIPGLAKICQHRIANKVSTQSLLSLFNLAAHLKSVCIKFAAQNPSVFESDECELLKQTNPMLFLELNGYGYRGDDNNTTKGKGKGKAKWIHKLIFSFTQLQLHWNWASPSAYQKIKN